MHGAWRKWNCVGSAGSASSADKCANSADKSVDSVDKCVGSVYTLK